MSSVCLGKRFWALAIYGSAWEGNIGLLDKVQYLHTIQKHAEEMSTLFKSQSSARMANIRLICRQSLDYTIACQHASIDRKVTAYHVCPHCRVLLGQAVGFICQVCYVFPAVDYNQTGEAGAAPIALI